MSEIEILKASLKETYERLEKEQEARRLSAQTHLNTLMSLHAAIIKIEQLEEELRQHKTKNNPQTKYIINPEWEKLGPKHNVEFDVKREYKEFNIGPAPQNANLPPIS